MESKQKLCDDFNKENPVGSPVIYTNGYGQEMKMNVRYAAEILGDHTPVVWLSGISGCVALKNVRKDEENHHEN